jgi:hypothetical protein
MEKKGKLASAIAGAIMAYVRMEEETRAKMQASTRMGSVNLWRAGARQDTMQLSRLYQLRLTKK